MENNLENGVAPEMETPEVQPVEAQPVEAQPVEAQPVAETPAAAQDFTATLNKTLEKGKELGKELLEKSGPVLEKAKNLPRKVWMIAGAAVVAVIALIVVLSLLGNTYKTPVENAEKLLNAKSVDDIVDGIPSLLNGFGESEVEDILRIIKKTETYEDAMQNAEDAFEDAVEDMEDEYGDNYKIEINIDDKEELEREDVRAFRDKLRNIGELKEKLEDIDSDDIEDMAEDLDIRESQVKDLIENLEDFCKLCKSADVEEGYELSLIITMDGSELDEPEEEEMTVNVFKVDGRWVPDVFSLISGFGLNIGSLVSSLG